jgi:predicted dehydrogenase
MITLGQIGLGYWGPNLLRSFDSLPASRVKMICDQDEGALTRLAGRYPHVLLTTEAEHLISDPEIDAVVVTSSSVTHYPLARAALEEGKHAFVEKPIALRIEEAQALVHLAEARNLVLMVGHLLLYHPAVAYLKELIASGELGDVYYLYTARRNLGKIRQDENAMWSLGPHDISVALYLLGEMPVRVSAHGQAYLQQGIEDTVFFTLRFADGRLVHSHVSWLDPHKVRRFTVVGSRKMAVFDDVEPAEKLRIYDKGVDRPHDYGRAAEYHSYGDALTLRFGDIYVPRIEMQEPLRLECQHFLDCIEQGRQPLSDGRNGLDVLRVLDALQRSLDHEGRLVAL